MQHKQNGIEIYEGVPTREQIISETMKPLLLIIDDLLLDIEPKFLDTLFTRGSHNWNVSVIFVTQSIFGGNNLKIARANTHYLILMRNPQAMHNVRMIGTQLYPGRLKYFMEAFMDATAQPYSYLCIDQHPNTPDSERLSTNIFPEERQICYLPIS
jgi:hypothetical protein